MKNRFFRKYRKILVTLVIVTCLICASCLFIGATDVDNTGGFGTALEQFIAILVDGITALGGGIGSGVNQYVSDLFLEVNTSGEVVGLSMFGGVAAIFGGVSLAIGLTTLIFTWIRSLGN